MMRGASAEEVASVQAISRRTLEMPGHQLNVPWVELELAKWWWLLVLTPLVGKAVGGAGTTSLSLSPTLDGRYRSATRKKGHQYGAES